MGPQKNTTEITASLHGGISKIVYLVSAIVNHFLLYYNIDIIAINYFMKTLLIKITGSRVHGVGFRFESYQQFVDLGLTGKAENTPEGLDIEVTGEEPNLEKFVEWAKQGPVGAKIERVEVKEGVGGEGLEKEK
jgi:acylphosphatase